VLFSNWCSVDRIRLELKGCLDCVASPVMSDVNVLLRYTTTVKHLPVYNTERAIYTPIFLCNPLWGQRNNWASAVSFLIYQLTWDRKMFEHRTRMKCVRSTTCDEQMTALRRIMLTLCVLQEYHRRIILTLCVLQEYHTRIMLTLCVLQEYHRRIILTLCVLQEYHTRIVLTLCVLQEYHRRIILTLCVLQEYHTRIVLTLCVLQE
jgi:hypothetical protein